ncbi:PglL family O-oligosaccharyltransferase [Buttiauxella brennerae]|uniref:PglL family O-oligosaccharyltransferase n=1 Tax=Buttiauxella brennerae TaxID=82988 RepID=UPI001428C099|nr:O-antigen ligase family protein [Buttiauxella brennerae]
MSTALIRLAGLWGGIALFWVLIQLRFSSQQRKFLLLSVLVGALIEWGITLWQLKTHSYDNWMEFVPGTRPYGIFQQINVLASFLATGYAIALWFCLNTANRLLTNFCRIAVVMLPTMLVILQSRVGYLGCAAVFVLLCVVYRHQPRKILLLLALSLCGVAIGELLKNSHWLAPLVAIVDKEGSNSERIYIMKSAIEMIRQRPIMGWGYGHFEYVVARVSPQLLHHTFPYPIPHAHNEFLFGWAEGGIAAAAGMLAIAAGYLTLIKGNNRYALPLWALSLPIALHTMTEYPLYQSAAHWLTLILLCRLCISEQPAELPQKKTYKVVAAAVVSISFCAVVFFASGFKTHQVLTEFERTGMKNSAPVAQLINPWVQWERYNYDRHVAMLLQFNQTHDAALLDNFYRWGSEYVGQHNDLNVYRSLISIARHQHNDADEQKLREQLAIIKPGSN